MSRLIDDYIVEQVKSFIDVNWDELNETYIEKIDAKEMSFDEYCIRMYFTNLVN